MAALPLRLLLRWLPVALGLLVLLGFVGYRLYLRATLRAPALTKRQPMSGPLIGGTPAGGKDRAAELLNRLGLAMSLRDAPTAERLAEEISRSGSDLLPALARLLLWLDPIPPEPLFQEVLKDFPPRSMAMAMVLGNAKDPCRGS